MERNIAKIFTACTTFFVGKWHSSTRTSIDILSRVCKQTNVFKAMMISYITLLSIWKSCLRIFLTVSSIYQFRLWAILRYYYVRPCIL